MVDVYTPMAESLPEAPEASAVPARKPPLKERLKAHFAEYGRVAIVVYLSATLVSIIVFAILIGMGWEPSSASGFIGLIIASWLAAKVTIPIRILVTLGLTPPISAFLVRRRERRAAREPAPDYPDA